MNEMNDKRVIINKPELLAPAGNLEKLKIAILYGADAVFIGGKEFSLRARASNFSIEDIKEAVLFARAHQAKVYVTTNIIAHNENLNHLEEYLQELYECGVSAIICADPFVIETAKKVVPNMEIHLSTQQSTTNSEAINFWYDEGVKRVVLARELSIHEIKKISQKTKAEIEVFIHGGMCVSYSGRCTLSNHMTDRDANRGGCAHSCRWNYRLYNQEDDLISAEDGHYNLSSKDLMAIPFIPELIEASVNSLKIEGRMKSIHYIATVVGTYRKLIDDYCSDPDHFVLDDKYYEEMSKAENRQTSVGALAGKPTENEQLYNVRTEKPTQEFIAIVLDYDEKSQIAVIEQRNYFTVGDAVEVYGPGFRKDYFTIDKIYDEDNNEIEVARHPRQILKVKIPFKVYPYDIIRKTRKKTNNN
ncbi:U32 family peptidase [Mycoplasmatota bacterium]|nr:U32 family peptidase [Mycoplasmatota bacterium]